MPTPWHTQHFTDQFWPGASRDTDVQEVANRIITLLLLSQFWCLLSGQFCGIWKPHRHLSGWPQLLGQVGQKGWHWYGYGQWQSKYCTAIVATHSKRCSQRCYISQRHNAQTSVRVVSLQYKSLKLFTDSFFSFFSVFTEQLGDWHSSCEKADKAVQRHQGWVGWAFRGRKWQWRHQT